MRTTLIFLLVIIWFQCWTVVDTQIASNLDHILRSFDSTCADIHTLLTYQRKIVNIRVTKESPVRVKIDMEITSQTSPSAKHYFSVEGMVCHHGFDRNAAQAACRSQNKKLQMYGADFEWEAAPDSLHDKCYFEYNNNPFVVPCTFVLDHFNCSSDASSLNDCTYASLFQLSCTKDMHVGISCSGTYEPPASTTTTTTLRTTTKKPTTDEETVTEVLDRHNWTDIGAVVDVTGSMSGCYAQIDQWIGLSEKNKLVKYFAFFNDGDEKPDSSKVIGSTGGIYDVYTSEGITKVMSVLNRAKTAGNGGDEPENDIEAILHAISHCPTCQNFIHIADNGATPRDLILLNQVTKPIKVVICRLATSANVNPKLLDIAYKTGGSLHTLHEDIETLGSVTIGTIIRIGTGVYRLDPNGFVRIA